MKLSTKAQRYVAEAVIAQGDVRAVRLWREFEASGSVQLPATLLPLAIAALEAEQVALREQLARLPADGDEYADLANDLHFVQAISDDLLRQSSAMKGKARAV